MEISAKVYESWQKSRLPPALKTGREREGNLSLELGGRNLDVGFNGTKGEGSIWDRPKPTSLLMFCVGVVLGLTTQTELMVVPSCGSGVLWQRNSLAPPQAQFTLSLPQLYLLATNFSHPINSI